MVSKRLDRKLPMLEKGVPVIKKKNLTKIKKNIDTTPLGV
jgi:hypothetical protein